MSEILLEEDEDLVDDDELKDLRKRLRRVEALVWILIGRLALEVPTAAQSVAALVGL